MKDGVLMTLVLSLDAGAAAGEVLQTACLETDQVESLILVKTPAGTVEVGDRCRSGLALHIQKLIINQNWDCYT